MTPSIAILGGSDEDEVRLLSERLAVRGSAPLVIDTEGYPGHGVLTCRGGRWLYDGIDLSAVRVWFLRSLHCLAFNGDDGGALERRPRAVLAARREKESLLRSLLRWAHGRDAAVINPIDAIACHVLKVDTLLRLAEAGLPVPETLATNDAAEVSAFAARHDEVIYKPLAGGAEAELLRPADLAPRRLAQLRSAPVLFQERVRGEDVRAYWLAGQIIGAGRLCTDAVDFRTGPQGFEPAELTRAEAFDVATAAVCLGLTFAAVDLKRTPEGRHVLLDVNPAPMFAGFERTTGEPVSDRVASCLMMFASEAAGVDALERAR